jgi:hypothetical protein
LAIIVLIDKDGALGVNVYCGVPEVLSIPVGQVTYR